MVLLQFFPPLFAMIEFQRVFNPGLALLIPPVLWAIVLLIRTMSPYASTVSGHTPVVTFPLTVLLTIAMLPPSSPACQMAAAILASFPLTVTCWRIADEMTMIPAPGSSGVL